MKSTRNITARVMKRVVGIEKKMLVKTLAMLFIVFTSMFVIFAVVIIAFIKDVRDLGTWDVLTLFWEDREIVADYWRDALSTFWLEVPNEYVFIFLGVLVISWIIYQGTREKRKMYSLRSQKLASYEKSSKIIKERNVK